MSLFSSLITILGWITLVVLCFIIILLVWATLSFLYRKYKGPKPSKIDVSSKQTPEESSKNIENL